MYLFQDAGGTILYVGKARSLRSRVRSYFLESSWQDAKTGSLVREIADLEYIVVDNEKEALALENNLIKQHKPKFNVLLRDDKTYPYIRYTAFEKFPRVYVTRRLKKDGSIYFGPYFPARLAYPMVQSDPQAFSGAVVHRRSDAQPPAPVPAVLHSPLPGPVRRRAGHRRALCRSRARRTTVSRRPPQRSARSLKERMQRASDEQHYEEAAGYRDLLRTLDEMEERQKIAAAEGDDTDVLAWYAEPPQVAVNLFHLRGGRVVDRRDFYWEDLEEFDPARISAVAAQAALSGRGLSAALHPRAHRISRIANCCEEVLTETGRPSRGDREPAARPEARVSRTGREEREAFVHAAFPRAASPARRRLPRRSNPRSGCPSRPSASSASTFRTFRDRTRSRRWWCGKTAG